MYRLTIDGTITYHAQLSDGTDAAYARRHAVSTAFFATIDGPDGQIVWSGYLTPAPDALATQATEETMNCGGCAKTMHPWESYVEYRIPAQRNGYRFTELRRYCLDCAKVWPKVTDTGIQHSPALGALAADAHGTAR